MILEIFFRSTLNNSGILWYAIIKVFSIGLISSCLETGFNIASIPNKKYFEKTAKTWRSFISLISVEYVQLLLIAIKQLYWYFTILDQVLLKYRRLWKVFFLFSCRISRHWHFSELFYFISHSAHFSQNSVFHAYLLGMLKKNR